MNQIETLTKDQQILTDRSAIYNLIPGPRVGDFVKLSNGSYQRFTHEWHDTFQAGAGADWGGFYLGNGYISYSGGLNGGVKRSDLVQTAEVKNGDVWFFHEGWAGANRGVHFPMQFRVFALVPGANETNLNHPYGGKY